MTVLPAPGGPQGASLWRQRDFMAVWAGQLVSVVGSSASATALPLLVLAETGSAAWAGAVGAAATLPPLLLGLPAGVLADRVPRRRVMRVSLVVSGAAMAGIGVAVGPQ